MRTAWTLLALLVIAGVGTPLGQAQDETAGDLCSALVVLVHHPYPDGKDPLGINWQNSGLDAYYGRYAHLDEEADGFDFPHTVFDGSIAIEGIPDSGAPYVSTRDAYEGAFQQRASLESPAQLDIAARANDGAIQATIHVSNTGQALEASRLTLFVAVVEDPVHYAPPPALSNGVTVHPFVVRAVEDRPQSGEGTYGFEFRLHEDWDPNQLLVAAWLQQGPVDGLQYDAHEVIQSALAAVDGPSRTDCGAQRSVLMEMYSATWCSTCLFGDRVAEEMAEREGILNERIEARNSYLVDTPAAWLWILLAVAGGVGLAWARLPGSKS